MILDDLMDYLSTGGIGLTTGTNLFVGPTAPDAPDRAAILTETGGFFPIHAMAGSAGQAVAERPRVQVVTRAPTYQGARQLIHNVFQRLDGAGNLTINTTRYLHMTAVSSPAPMGLDGSGRHRCVVNFDVTKKLHTSTST